MIKSVRTNIGKREGISVLMQTDMAELTAAGEDCGKTIRQDKIRMENSSVTVLKTGLECGMKSLHLA